MIHSRIPHGGQPDAETITGPQYEDLYGGVVETWPDGRVEVETIIPRSSFEASLTTIEDRLSEA